MAEQNRIKELEIQLETAQHQTRLANIRFDYERKWAKKDELNQLEQRDDAQRKLEERYKALEVQLKEKSEPLKNSTKKRVTNIDDEPFVVCAIKFI